MSKLPHFDSTCRDLDLKRDRVLAELHPSLDAKVRQICTMLGGRVAPYCGYRGPHDQQDALARGASRASFGDSPHNFHPSYACDLVIDPRMVEVRENPDENYPGFPDLWDDTSPAAVQLWKDLDVAAAEVGLVRVDLDRNKHDNPHVQLVDWRNYVK